jgi:lipopolysaccharide/colanic/teichoic acid biosynthesis glycosyltransferase
MISREHLVSDREAARYRGTSATILDSRQQPGDCSQVQMAEKLLRIRNRKLRYEFATRIAATQSCDGLDGRVIGAVNESDVYLVTKRAIDVIVASIMLILLLPLFVLVSVLIAMETGTPILYFQQRVGFRRKAFRFYKFRSMVRSAERLKCELAAQNEAVGPIFKIRRDPRVTRVGRIIRRFSIDELPQLIAVVRGEMSLVGPRPLAVKEAPDLGSLYGRRYDVRPGLMCLREVCGRSALTYREWMELDLLYVQTRSLKMDLRILRQALESVIMADNAY